MSEILTCSFETLLYSIDQRQKKSWQIIGEYKIENERLKKQNAILLEAVKCYAENDLSGLFPIAANDTTKKAKEALEKIKEVE